MRDNDDDKDDHHNPGATGDRMDDEFAFEPFNLDREEKEGYFDKVINHYSLI
jgi:hypothetical protein